MSILQLKEIINPNAIQEINDDFIVLKEPKDNSSLKIVKISKIPNYCIVMKGDIFQLNTIFYQKKDFLKYCDYIIISEDTIYYIELKSHKKSPEVKRNEVYNQFKTVECIVDLIDCVFNRFSYSNFRLNKLNKKFFLLYDNPNLAKTRTSLKNDFEGYKNNTANDFHSLAVKDGEEIYFDEIK